MFASGKHSIEIVIDEDGKLTAEVLGIEGQACTAISAFLDSLGTVEVDRHTADYNKTPRRPGVTQGVSVK